MVSILVAGTLGFMSCQKNDLTSGGDLASNLDVAVADVLNTQVSEVNTSEVQSVSVEKFDGSDHVVQFDGFRPNWKMDGKGPIRFGIPHIDSCAIVTVSSATYPKVITIDYGTGCTDRKGHVKKGKIVISISDTITTAGATKSIVYENFYIDSIKVDLTASLKNLGKNASGNWEIQQSWAQTITKNSDISTQKNEETIEWVSGFETTDKSDDIYWKSGQGSITLNDSLTYSRAITKPLYFDRSCGFIKSGTVELLKKGNTIVIDYGDGTCDSVATVATNGTNEEIDLQHNEYRDGGEFKKHGHKFGHKGKG